MSRATLGQSVPNFELPATGAKTVRLSGLRGKKVILYFYPKDNTPGCTREGQEFSDHIAEFAPHNAVILGVSRDSIRSHEGFKSKLQLPFDLLSDEDEILCRQYDVIKEKTMFGRKVMGVERSTFLIDENGILRKEWRKVKVAGHISEVLDAIRST
jgi:peroxiredoxin Q/BCP